MALAAAALLVAACATQTSPPASVGDLPSTAPSAGASGRPSPTASGQPEPSGQPSPIGSPLPVPRLGIDWAKAASVERPADAFPSPDPSVAFSLGSNRSGHPLHFPGQAMISDVVRRSGGALVAVGSVYPGWHPQAWTSPDGETWTLAPMGTAEFTFPVALAVGADDTVVAVGRTGSRPLAWTSQDGRVWLEHPVATLGPSSGTTAERMTAVIATPDGFLAGGSVGPELGDRHARFWSSADGSTWRPVADDPAVFADAEVTSILRTADGFVAIGLVGNVQDISGSVAWRSTDGRSWSPIDDQSLAKGRAVSMVTAPGGGIVAVGSDLDQHEAFAWTSLDGRTWTLAPSEASRQYHGKIRMTDVTVIGDELIGVGNYVGLQRGTAISWVSTDGLHWEQARSAPVQEQGEIYAVSPGGPGIVAVGSFGAPDDYIPTVWLSPGR